MSKILDLIYRIQGETSPLDELKGKITDVGTAAQETGTDMGAWDEEPKAAIEGLQVPTRALSQILRSVGADGAASAIQLTDNFSKLIPVINAATGATMALNTATLGVAAAIVGLGVVLVQVEKDLMTSAEKAQDLKDRIQEIEQATKDLTVAQLLEKAAGAAIYGNKEAELYWREQAKNADAFNQEMERMIGIERELAGIQGARPRFLNPAANVHNPPSRFK